MKGYFQNTCVRVTLRRMRIINMAEIFKIAVLVSGRGSNMEALINASMKNPELGYEVVCVLSDNPSAPALDIARAHRVEALFADPGDKYRTRLTEEAEARYAELLRERKVDCIMLAGFMRLLKGALLRDFEGKILNIHPSLLPKFPGLDVHQRVIEAGERESGCTVHFVDAGMDTGPIIGQAVVPVKEGDNAETLAHRVLKQEHRLYPHVASLIATGAIKAGDKPVLWQTHKELEQS